MSSTSPFFSVIILTYHRNRQLSQCLDCLVSKNQEIVEHRYEIIVSDDGYESTAAEMIKRDYPHVKWVKGPRQGIAANRNNGAKYAKGEWIVFTDDDCLPQRGWLREIEKYIAEHEYVSVIEGRITEPVSAKETAFTQIFSNDKGGNYFTGNLAFKTAFFKALDGYDEDFKKQCEDMEMGFRIQKSNCLTGFCHTAIVIHPERKISFKQFLLRPFMLKWYRLYELKCGFSPKIDSPFSDVIRIVIQKTLGLFIRYTYQDLKEIFSKKNKDELFKSGIPRLYSWSIMPILLVYLIYWDFVYRSRLNRNLNGVSN